MSNPDNFVEHRRYLMRLSVQVSRAGIGFGSSLEIDSQSTLREACGSSLARMVSRRAHTNESPPKVCAGDQGASYGRGIGIIDTIHLVEVANAI
jgi:hypothetical protein